MRIAELAAGVSVAMVFFNLATLAMNIKLYTEVMKERAQQRRHSS